LAEEVTIGTPGSAQSVH